MDWHLAFALRCNFGQFEEEAHDVLDLDMLMDFRRVTRYWSSDEFDDRTKSMKASCLDTTDAKSWEFRTAVRREFKVTIASLKDAKELGLI